MRQYICADISRRLLEKFISLSLPYLRVYREAKTLNEEKNRIAYRWRFGHH